MGGLFSKSKKKQTSSPAGAPSIAQMHRSNPSQQTTIINTALAQSTSDLHKVATTASASPPTIGRTVTAAPTPASSMVASTSSIASATFVITPDLPKVAALISPIHGRSVSGEQEAEDVTVDDGTDDSGLALETITPITSNGEASLSFWDINRTYRPPKDLSGGRAKLGQTIKATMRATLGGGDLSESVKLPPGEDMNEWIAVNTVHFFNAASMIYGTCQQFCTQQSCPMMTAGRAEYLWKDDRQYKRPTRLSAPQYIELMLTWVDEQLSDESLFPVVEGAKFPRNFQSIVKNIYKRLFRLYAHLYCTHAEKIRAIGANAHLNTCFKHFIYFSEEFRLIDRNDLAPLERLITKMRENDQKAMSVYRR